MLCFYELGVLSIHILSAIIQRLFFIQYNAKRAIALEPEILSPHPLDMLVLLSGPYWEWRDFDSYHFCNKNKSQLCFEGILVQNFWKLCYHVGASSYILTFFNVYYPGPQVTGTFGCGEHRTSGTSYDNGGVWA